MMNTYDEKNRILKAEIAEAKALLEHGQAKIRALLQNNSDLEIALKRDLRSQAKNVNFGNTISGAWTAAEHGIPLPPPVYCTNISCENGPAWLYPILDSRVSLSAKPSCEDGPAPIVPKVHTLNVRVWRDGSRLVGVNRRAAMRALMTGTSLPGYAAKVQFATADGLTVTAEGIDWTGFGLQPIISVRRVIVLRNMGVLDESFERDAVLAEFQRTGTLPTGYQFPLKYWNLKPQDVNFAVGAAVGS